MVAVRDTFKERVEEINIYFDFVFSYELNSSNKELHKILKSNLILMLYNLIESTISNSIEEIHNNIYAHSISFDSLKSDLKKIIIKHIKELKPDSFVTNINDIATDIIKHSFIREKMFSGNIDSKKIKEIGSKYGFSSDTKYEKTCHGSCLVEIKGRRNDLAHGVYSFTEVGKNYSLQDLENLKNETIFYLDEILDNIEYYLICEEYKN